MSESTAAARPGRKAYVCQYLLADLTAHWADNISAIIIDSRPYGLSVHLGVEAAGKFAADLIDAIAATGAKFPPESLLLAFMDAADHLRDNPKKPGQDHIVGADKMIPDAEPACRECVASECGQCTRPGGARLAADDKRYPTCCCGRWFRDTAEVTTR